jgi:DNA-directed RNA polymerase subunit RPC12/RpoP
MSGSPTEVIGHCGECGHAIPAGYPYGWCVKCGAGLPGELKEQLGQPRDGSASPARDGVPLTVHGNPVACPICRHDRFRMRKAIMEGQMAAWFDMDWASPVATTYICLRCGHVMWFMR